MTETKEQFHPPSVAIQKARILANQISSDYLSPILNFDIDEENIEKFRRDWIGVMNNDSPKPIVVTEDVEVYNQSKERFMDSGIPSDPEKW